MDLVNNARLFSAYNRWANRLLYDAAQTLSDADYNKDAGAFFKSMNGTLNHMLIADRIWMKRFTGRGDHPTSLEAILHPDFAGLRAAREIEDKRIIDWVERLSSETIGGDFTFTMMTKPEQVTQKLWPCISHFFNHQTHHRGHAHMNLTVLGKEPPALDLVYFLRTSAGRALSVADMSRG